MLPTVRNQGTADMRLALLLLLLPLAVIAGLIVHAPARADDEALFDLPKVSHASLVATPAVRAWFVRADDTHALQWRLDVLQPPGDKPLVVRSITCVSRSVLVQHTDRLQPKGRAHRTSGKLALKELLGEQHRTFARENGSIVISFAVVPTDGEAYGSGVQSVAMFSLPIHSYGKWLAGTWDDRELPE